MSRKREESQEMEQVSICTSRPSSACFASDSGSREFYKLGACTSSSIFGYSDGLYIIHLDNGEHGLNFVFEHFEAARQLAFDLVHGVFSRRVRPDCPAPEGPDALAQLVPLVIQIDRQQPSEQLLTDKRTARINHRESHSRLIERSSRARTTVPRLVRLGRYGKVAHRSHGGRYVFAIDVEAERPRRIRRLARYDAQAVLHFRPGNGEKKTSTL